jgi:hypothetical protein
MIRLTEILEGDDVNNFDLVTSEIRSKLRGYNDGTFTISDLAIKEPVKGTMDNVPFISECIIVLHVITKRIYPEMIQDIYILVGGMIQEMGYGDYPFKFKIDYIRYDDYGLSLPLITDLPHNIVQHLRYDVPSLHTINMGQYRFVIPSDVLPKVSDDIGEWVRIKRKKATVLYDALKKGKVNGVEYTLRDTPEDILVYANGKNIDSPKELNIYVQSGIETINGKTRDESEDRDVFYRQKESIMDSLKEKFKKMGLNLI